jgi:peptidoglycan/LPS O-acetylase OafA/YrhL
LANYFRETHDDLISLKGRIPGLDILRSLAILGVIFFHSNSLLQTYPHALITRILSFCWIGVDLFFVLSGHLLTRLVIKQVEQGKAFRPIRFFSRRAYRIWPLYYFILLLWIPLTQVGIYSPVFENRSLEFLFTRYLISPLFFLSNYIPSNLVPGSWSLCIEEHFYAVFAIAGLWLFSRLSDKKKNKVKIACLLSVAFLVLLSRHFTFQKYHDFSYNLIWSHNRFDQLALGCLTAFVVHLNHYRLKRAIHWLCLIFGTLFVSAAFIVFSTAGDWSKWVLNYTLIGMGFALITMSFSVRDFHLPRKVLTLFTIIAKLSYSAYLVHFFLAIPKDLLFVVLLKIPFGSPFHFVASTFFFLLVTFGASFITYTFIERPFLILRNR